MQLYKWHFRSFFPRDIMLIGTCINFVFLLIVRNHHLLKTVFNFFFYFVLVYIMRLRLSLQVIVPFGGVGYLRKSLSGSLVCKYTQLSVNITLETEINVD